MKNKSSILTGVLSGLFWGLGLTISGYLFLTYDISPFVVSLIHDFFSVILLAVLIIIKYGKINFKIFKSMKNYALVIAAILAGPVGMQLNLYSVKYVGAGLTASITAVYPAMAVILSIIFLKNKVDNSTMLGIFLIVGSLFIQTFEFADGENTYLGLVFALFCALAWASESVLSSYAMANDLKPIEALFIRQITSFLIYLIILLLFTSQNMTFNAGINAGFIILAMTGINMTSYLMYYIAINKLDASKATGLNVSYVVWTAVFSALFLASPLDIKTIITSFVIMLGVYIIIREKN